MDFLRKARAQRGNIFNIENNFLMDFLIEGRAQRGNFFNIISIFLWISEEKKMLCWTNCIPCKAVFLKIVILRHIAPHVVVEDSLCFNIAPKKWCEKMFPCERIFLFLKMANFLNIAPKRWCQNKFLRNRRAQRGKSFNIMSLFVFYKSLRNRRTQR